MGERVPKGLGGFQRGLKEMWDEEVYLEVDCRRPWPDIWSDLAERMNQ